MLRDSQHLVPGPLPCTQTPSLPGFTACFSLDLIQWYPRRQILPSVESSLYQAVWHILFLPLIFAVAPPLVLQVLQPSPSSSLLHVESPSSATLGLLLYHTVSLSIVFSFYGFGYDLKLLLDLCPLNTRFVCEWVSYRPFKTEVPKCNLPAPRFCSASNVFCFDYSLHFIIWTAHLGIPCGCLLSSSPSTSKHWPLLVSFCSHFYNPCPSVGGNNCLHVLVAWLTASSLSSL